MEAPIAKKFMSRGRGNGFPFCISDAINVLDRGDGNPYDYWTTLGGFNKDSSGSPSQEQIALSFRNARNLCWSLYALNGSAKAASVDNEGGGDGEDGGDGGDGEDGGDFMSGFMFGCEVNQVSFGEYTSSNFPSSIMDAGGEPRTRVCLSRYGRTLRNEDEAPWNEQELTGHSELSIFLYFYRMCLGDTTDEDKFIGYGFGGLRGWSETFGTTVEVELNSAVDEIYTPPYEDEAVDYAYTTISGIPFVCRAQSFSGNNDSQDVDAEAHRAAAIHERTIFLPRSQTEVQLDSLIFYAFE